MLMRGTTKKNRQELEDALDKLRARIGVSGSETGASVSGKNLYAAAHTTITSSPAPIQRPTPQVRSKTPPRPYRFWTTRPISGPTTRSPSAITSNTATPIVSAIAIV